MTRSGIVPPAKKWPLCGVGANLHSQANTVQGHVTLGLVYRHRGRLNEAVREFDSAIALQPTLSDLHLLRALTLEAAARIVEAIRAFQTAWDYDVANPGKAYLVLSRARTRRRSGRGRATSGRACRHTRRQEPRRLAAGADVDAVPDTFRDSNRRRGRLAGLRALAAGKLTKRRLPSRTRPGARPRDSASRAGAGRHRRT